MIGLILASPFMLITAVAIKAYDHGPVLYKQIRLTKDGKCFKILKFRSMRVDAEKDGVAVLRLIMTIVLLPLVALFVLFALTSFLKSSIS